MTMMMVMTTSDFSRLDFSIFGYEEYDDDGGGDDDNIDDAVDADLDVDDDCDDDDGNDDDDDDDNDDGVWETRSCAYSSVVLKHKIRRAQK